MVAERSSSDVLSEVASLPMLQQDFSEVPKFSSEDFLVINCDPVGEVSFFT